MRLLSRKSRTESSFYANFINQIENKSGFQTATKYFCCSLLVKQETPQEAPCGVRNMIIFS